MALTHLYMPSDLRGLRGGPMVAGYGGTVPVVWSDYMAKGIVPDPQLATYILELQKTLPCRGPNKPVIGPQGGGLTFQIPFRGAGAAGAPAVVSELVSMAQYWGMTRTAIAAGADKVTGGTANTVTLLDADVGNLEVGKFIAVNADESGTPDFQIRYITKLVSAAGTTTLTVFPNWTTTPVNLDSWKPLCCLTPTIAECSGYMGFESFLGQGATHTAEFQFLDCAGSWKLPSVKAGEVPFAEITILANRWNHTQDTEAYAADAFDPVQPMTGCKLYLDNDALDVENVAFDPGLAPVMIDSPRGAHGRVGVHYNTPKPKIELGAYYFNEAPAALKAQTEFTLLLTSITSMNHFWALAIPAVTLRSLGIEDRGNGLIGLKPDIEIIDPGYNDEVVPAAIPSFGLCFSGPGA